MKQTALQVLTWLFTIAALVCFVTIMTSRRWWREATHETEQAPPTDIVDVCMREGVVVTATERLRAAVTIADLMAAQERSIGGRRVTPAQLRAAADLFARAQPAPGLALDALGRSDNCDSLKQYQQGYWLIASALMREITARRENMKA